jgi:3-oxoacyl-[acyl-carrier protein] reductase
LEKKEKIKRFKSKTALITGGANNIGKAISKLFASEGAEVLMLDTDCKKGRALEKEIKQAAGSATFLPGDVTEKNSIDSVIEKIIKDHGRLDILVNNVGGSRGDELEEIDEESFDRDVNLNFKSCVFLTKSCMQLLRQSQNASICYITSINALTGGFGAPIYSSMKNAIHSFIRCMVADYSKYGIRFNAVCAGSVPSESKGWQELKRDREDILERLNLLYPLGRYGRPEDIANAVLFISSCEASWITGQYLLVDGGLSAVGNLPSGKHWWEDI